MSIDSASGALFTIVNDGDGTDNCATPSRLGGMGDRRTGGCAADCGDGGGRVHILGAERAGLAE